MNIGIIGSGGREHSICRSLLKSNKIKKLFCFPGNGGTSEIATNVPLDLTNFEEIKDFIFEKKIDLIIVGPEKPLVDGIVDYLEKFNIKVFGPNSNAAKLEGSKIFTKQICKEYNIPTANFGIFKNKIDANKFIENSKYPLVVKADNLASGKGVYICNNFSESELAINEIFDGKFGNADKLLVEEFLDGEEMSYFVVSDGKNLKFFQTAQDHKRVSEGDKGKNTGGMGAYSPSRLINDDLEKKILERIVNPTIKALLDKDIKYKGFLYAGLMIVKNDPYLIEYNVRMGDPECQTILPILKSNLLDIILACCDEKLEKVNIEWRNKKSLCVVVCSKGYPEKFKKHIEIKNLRKINLENDDYLYHAGTLKKNRKYYAIGGRVLNFVSVSENFLKAKENINKNLKNLNWSGGFFRKDIGYRVIDT
tara:strand:- start:1027 stop:2292 length:1266 start_codon:yes stop_codon:yes gene_type:complete